MDLGCPSRRHALFSKARQTEFATSCFGEVLTRVYSQAYSSLPCLVRVDYNSQMDFILNNKGETISSGIFHCYTFSTVFITSKLFCLLSCIVEFVSGDWRVGVAGRQRMGYN